MLIPFACSGVLAWALMGTVADYHSLSDIQSAYAQPVWQGFAHIDSHRVVISAAAALDCLWSVVPPGPGWAWQAWAPSWASLLRGYADGAVGAACGTWLHMYEEGVDFGYRRGGGTALIGAGFLLASIELAAHVLGGVCGGAFLKETYTPLNAINLIGAMEQLVTTVRPLLPRTACTILLVVAATLAESLVDSGGAARTARKVVNTESLLLVAAVVELACGGMLAVVLSVKPVCVLTMVAQSVTAAATLGLGLPSLSAAAAGKTLAVYTTATLGAYDPWLAGAAVGAAAWAGEPTTHTVCRVAIMILGAAVNGVTLAGGRDVAKTWRKWGWRVVCTRPFHSLLICCALPCAVAAPYVDPSGDWTDMLNFLGTPTDAFPAEDIQACLVALGAAGLTVGRLKGARTMAALEQLATAARMAMPESWTFTARVGQLLRLGALGGVSADTLPGPIQALHALPAGTSTDRRDKELLKSLITSPDLEGTVFALLICLKQGYWALKAPDLKARPEELELDGTGQHVKVTGRAVMEVDNITDMDKFIRHGSANLWSLGFTGASRRLSVAWERAKDMGDEYALPYFKALCRNNGYLLPVECDQQLYDSYQTKELHEIRLLLKGHKGGASQEELEAAKRQNAELHQRISKLDEKLSTANNRITNLDAEHRTLKEARRQGRASDCSGAGASTRPSASRCAGQGGAGARMTARQSGLYSSPRARQITLSSCCRGGLGERA